jgi:hypothetical protein
MTKDPDPSSPTPQPPPVDLETDERFPTGPWEGFFLQPQLTSQIRQWMELHLTFRHGTVQGEGRDRVGKFAVKGRYSTDDGKCYWTKRYVGKHDVFYNGYNEGKGIWGLWELKSPPWRGGFHIWPVGMSDPTQHRLATAVDVPVDPEGEEAPAEPELATVGAGAEEGTSFDQGLGI